MIRCRGKWKWLGITAFFIISMTVAVQSAEPKRILLIDSGREFAPWNEYSNAILTELRNQWSEPLDIYEASLATARASEVPFASYLRSLFPGSEPNLIVTIGGPAARFVQQFRHELFPSAPMLLTAVEQRLVQYGNLSTKDAVVATKLDLAVVFDNMLKVLPNTTKVAVVIGNSTIERYWLEQLQSTLQPLADRVTFTWFNGLSLDEMLKRAAALPPRSAIFYLLLSADVAGVPQFHAVANAPIFSYTDAHFGKGIVGGPLISVQEGGQTAARVAVRILRGETPGSIRTEPVQLGTPRFDWREMQRWDISEANLPAGSIVEFRAPTVFEQYKWYIVAAVAICLIEAFFIFALLLNRRRLEREHIERLRAEGAARDFSERLISAQEDERSRLARELHDDVTQRLAVLAIDAGRAARSVSNKDTDETIRQMREGLVKLSEDVHDLSYRLHPSILDDLGLIEALKVECKRFSRLESIPVDVRIQKDLVVPAGQSALCLFRIAQEALKNVGRHARAGSVDVSIRRVNNGLQLHVRDDGVGFDPEHRREKPSLGLASMRQRVYQLGGELDIESKPGQGTMVLAWVPWKEEYRESPARAVG